ncbi:DUF4906 domain-containing protein [Parabacteroides chongii]|uniref:DUF4906 domain-containing protein n=1 Tax=Parabacteroides chongii TaxID=2685834 RepID=UPI00240E43F1|nr:DUF4906 domain-containing protein [Parabacteroides chongii]WFE83766.1 DUF4906 domain-containing protein [Parabacteroides chongii]
MGHIGSKLQKQGVLIVLFTLVLINASCDGHIDNSAVNPTDEKKVEVSMAIGFADEADACNLSASTKANAKGKGAFDVELVPTATTRADAAKPDKLYRLEIRQYKQNGECYTGSGQDPTDREIGKRLTVSLTKDADCQLVFVAWGKDSPKLLGKIALSEAQEISIDAATINAISTADMSQMPYVLHLKHVNVTSGGKITSPDGEDVRILLKRLATRLNIFWNYNVPNYDLKQIILQSIPRNYKVVPAPDEKSMNTTYPSVMDQYMDIQLTDAQISAADKSCSCWVPANVRGINTVSNGPQYRIKENAPVGSSYVSFIAANTSDGKKKLNYRVYLGGKDYSDYNLNENTDYSYKISFNHTGLPVDDKRVTIIDPIPASDNNENFVPTANCFMVAPGGAFCFNPYKYYVNGSISENELLKGWCASSKIKSVKVLWQTKENGDVGDPVLGVVNSLDDHTNIVDLKDGDDFDKARIYCRVAPNTTGGSGLIAAYDGDNGTGNILWSWHVWVTDYNPDPRGSNNVLTPENRRKQVYKLNGTSQLPMMDRNLGAVAGYLTVPQLEQDRSKANGFMYQWGRKDMFRSSYTIKFIPSIDVPEVIESPLDGVLSCYRGDGITFASLTFDFKNSVTYEVAYKNPEILYKPSGNFSWTSQRNNDYYNSWGMEGDKGLHDPCPVGWRVCKKEDFYPLYTQANTNGRLNIVAGSNVNNDGGYLISYNEDDRTQGSYFRLPGYWMGNVFGYIGTFGYYWTRDNGKGSGGYNGNSGYPLRLKTADTNWNMKVGGVEQEALLVRCIQERE